MTRSTSTGDRTRLRRGFLFAVPIATAGVIALHPADPRTAADLGDQSDLYLWIHVGLLFMLPLLGIVVWTLLDGLSGPFARVARVALPITLVFYAAFDALVGIAGGLLSREALQMSGAERAGAEALTARWLEIPIPISIISTIAVVSWTVTMLAAAGAHWRAGSSWPVVAGLAAAGPLFGFGHPYFTGVLAMAGLLIATVVHETGAPRAGAARIPGRSPRSPRRRSPSR